MNYTIYNIANGQIDGNITSSSNLLSDLKVSDCQGIIEGDFPSSQYYINITTKTPVMFPPKPNESYTFDYNTKTWILDSEKQWKLISQFRNILLQNSDWTQLPDVPLNTKEAWANYRQQLRDITNQADPFNIVWPIAPT
jgi:hypothetical protein